MRTLCTSCRRQDRALPEIVDQLGLARYSQGNEVLLWHAVGCDECNGTGFRGRTGLVETLVLGDDLRRIILRKGEAKELQRAAVQAGMTSMYEDGLQKALDGQTTIEEVLRVTRDV